MEQISYNQYLTVNPSKGVKRIDFNQAMQLLSNLGVIAGIIFLGVEIRQNTAAVQGDTYQALSDSSTNQHIAVATDPDLALLVRRVYTGATREDLTPTEESQLFYYYNAILQRLENSFLQYEAGLIDERAFESYGWNDGIFETEHFLFYWDFIASRLNTSAAFREFFESMKGIEPTEPSE